MKTNRLLFLGALGLAAAALGAGCSGRDAAEGSTDGGGSAVAAADAAARGAVLVSPSDIALARGCRLEAGVSFAGELTPLQVTDVMARFDGDLQRVLVREGQAVRAGQSLAVYRPRDVDDALVASQAGLLAARAELAAAESGLRRVQRLLDAGAAAPSEMEAAMATRAAAEARVRVAEAANNRADEDVQKLSVPAPIGGAVSKLIVHDGSRTAVGDRLMTIVDTRTLELSATLASEALAGARPGALLRFHVDAYPQETFEGVVDRVNPTTEPGTRQLRIYTKVENPEGKLVGGLFVSGRVITAAKERALAAPAGALRTEGRDHVVYRVRHGRAQRVVVTTGLLDETAGLMELLGEVAEGDSLLMGVLPGIRDGAAVRVLGGEPTR